LASHKPLCEQYPPTSRSSPFGNRLTLGGYLAAIACDDLPGNSKGDSHVSRHGYAVGFGEWMFFTAIEPAVTFGRAARMSLDCHGWGVYEAAQRLQYCARHRHDELVLLVSTNAKVPLDGEIEQMKQFVQGVKEHPWSSHWIEPTGYLTDYDRGHVTTTRRPSLPL
jgi:hypothetical protein